MSYKRKLKKFQLIQKLYDLCTQIPDHVVKCSDAEKLRIPYDAGKGYQQMLTIEELHELSSARIEGFLRLKQKEINMHEMINQLKGKR